MANRISIWTTSKTTTNGVTSTSKTPRPAPGTAWVKKGSYWVKPAAPVGADVAWDDNKGWVAKESVNTYELTLAVIKSDPSLQSIFDEAWAAQKAGKEWSEEQFITRIKSSTWYTSKSQTQREYYKLANDPAQVEEFKRQVTEKKATLSYLAKASGINASDTQLDELSKKALEFGYSEEQITSIMADYIDYVDNGIDNVIGSLTGRAGDVEDQIRDWAKRNGVTVSNSWVIGQIRNAAKSGWDESKATDYITGIAKQQFSHWADKLDADTTVDDLAAGFKQLYSEEMDVDFQTLDLNNSFIRKAMLATDDKGMPVNTDTVRKDLYKTNEWSDVTKNKNKIIGAGQALLTRMGIY